MRTFYWRGPSRRLPLFGASKFAPLSGLRELIVPSKQAPEGRSRGRCLGRRHRRFAPAASPRIYELSANWDIGSYVHPLRSPLLLRRRNKICLSPRRSNAIVLWPRSPRPCLLGESVSPGRNVDLWTQRHFKSGGIEGGSILELKRRHTTARKGPAKLVESLSETPPICRRNSRNSIASHRSRLRVSPPTPTGDWAGSLRSFFLTGVIANRGRRALRVSFHLLAYYSPCPSPPRETRSYSFSWRPAGMLFAWPWYCGQSHSFLPTLQGQSGCGGPTFAGESTLR